MQSYLAVSMVSVLGLQVDDAAGQLEFLVEVGASGVAAQPSQLLYLQALLAWHRGSNPAQVGFCIARVAQAAALPASPAGLAQGQQPGSGGPLHCMGGTGSCSSCKPSWPGTGAATRLRWGPALHGVAQAAAPPQALLAWHRGSNPAQVGPGWWMSLFVLHSSKPCFSERGKRRNRGCGYVSNRAGCDQGRLCPSTQGVCRLCRCHHGLGLRVEG